MKKTVLSCLFISAASITFAQANWDSVKVFPVKVTESIYFLKVYGGGNVGVIIGKDGTLIVDDHFAPLSNRINGAIKTLSPGEIRFLVNTHIHGDHSGGNENFKKMGVTVVAHNNVRERMMKESKRQDQVIPPRPADAWPVLTFTDKTSFHLNDEDIELIPLNPGHTDGDVIIRFVKANVFHTGDSFVRYGYPYIDLGSGGLLTGFINNLDKILSVLDDNSKVIPGHGELATKADVKKLRDQLADIRDNVAAALKKGKKVEDIVNSEIATKYDPELGKGFMKGKDFVLLTAEALKPLVVETGKKK